MAEVRSAPAVGYQDQNVPEGEDVHLRDKSSNEVNVPEHNSPGESSCEGQLGVLSYVVDDVGRLQSTQECASGGSSDIPTPSEKKSFRQGDDYEDDQAEQNDDGQEDDDEQGEDDDSDDEYEDDDEEDGEDGDEEGEDKDEEDDDDEEGDDDDNAEEEEDGEETESSEEEDNSENTIVKKEEESDNDEEGSNEEDGNSADEHSPIIKEENESDDSKSVDNKDNKTHTTEMTEGSDGSAIRNEDSQQEVGEKTNNEVTSQQEYDAGGVDQKVDGECSDGSGIGNEDTKEEVAGKSSIDVKCEEEYDAQGLDGKVSGEGISPEMEMKEEDDIIGLVDYDNVDGDDSLDDRLLDVDDSTEKYKSSEKAVAVDGFIITRNESEDEIKEGKEKKGHEENLDPKILEGYESVMNSEMDQGEIAAAQMESQPVPVQLIPTATKDVRVIVDDIFHGIDPSERDVHGRIRLAKAKQKNVKFENGPEIKKEMLGDESSPIEVPEDLSVSNRKSTNAIHKPQTLPEDLRLVKVEPSDPKLEQDDEVIDVDKLDNEEERVSESTTKRPSEEDEDGSENRKKVKVETTEKKPSFRVKGLAGVPRSLPSKRKRRETEENVRKHTSEVSSLKAVASGSTTTSPATQTPAKKIKKEVVNQGGTKVQLTPAVLKQEVKEEKSKGKKTKKTKVKRENVDGAPQGRIVQKKVSVVEILSSSEDENRDEPKTRKETVITVTDYVEFSMDSDSDSQKSKGKVDRTRIKKKKDKGKKLEKGKSGGKIPNKDKTNKPKTPPKPVPKAKTTSVSDKGTIRESNCKDDGDTSASSTKILAEGTTSENPIVIPEPCERRRPNRLSLRTVDSRSSQTDINIDNTSTNVLPKSSLINQSQQTEPAKTPLLKEADVQTHEVDQPSTADAVPTVQTVVEPCDHEEIKMEIKGAKFSFPKELWEKIIMRCVNDYEEKKQKRKEEQKNKQTGVTEKRHERDRNDSANVDVEDESVDDHLAQGVDDNENVYNEEVNSALPDDNNTILEVSQNQTQEHIAEMGNAEHPQNPEIQSKGHTALPKYDPISRRTRGRTIKGNINSSSGIYKEIIDEHSAALENFHIGDVQKLSVTDTWNTFRDGAGLHVSGNCSGAAEGNSNPIIHIYASKPQRFDKNKSNTNCDRAFGGPMISGRNNDLDDDSISSNIIDSSDNAVACVADFAKNRPTSTVFHEMDIVLDDDELYDQSDNTVDDSGSALGSTLSLNLHLDTSGGTDENSNLQETDQDVNNIENDANSAGHIPFSSFNPNPKVTKTKAQIVEGLNKIKSRNKIVRVQGEKYKDTFVPVDNTQVDGVQGSKNIPKVNSPVAEPGTKQSGQSESDQIHKDRKTVEDRKAPVEKAMGVGQKAYGVGQKAFGVGLKQKGASLKATLLNKSKSTSGACGVGGVGGGGSMKVNDFYRKQLGNLNEVKELLNTQRVNLSMAEVTDFLKDFGRIPLHTKSDPNALMHSIARQCNNYSGGKQLRLDVLNHITDNRLKYEFLIRSHTDMDYFDYIRDMRSVKQPCDEVLIIATADYLKRNISLLTQDIIWNYFDDHVEEDIVVAVITRNYVYATKRLQNEQEASHLGKKDLMSKTVYNCWICKKKFKSLPILNTHRRTHRRKRYPCGQCSMVYCSNKTLNQHVLVKHEGQMYQCDKEGCDKEFETANSLKLHEKEHNCQYNFVCEHCSRGYMKRDHFEHHIARHNKIRIYKCANCPKDFVRKQDLRRHLLKSCEDTKEKEVECNLCGKILKNSDTLRNHKNHVHFEGQIYQCKFCKEKMSQHYTTINRHMRQYHREHI